jgi:hypothetical protein
MIKANVISIAQDHGMIARAHDDHDRIAELCEVCGVRKPALLISKRQGHLTADPAT